MNHTLTIKKMYRLGKFRVSDRTRKMAQRRVFFERAAVAKSPVLAIDNPCGDLWHFAAGMPKTRFVFICGDPKYARICAKNAYPHITTYCGFLHDYLRTTNLEFEFCWLDLNRTMLRKSERGKVLPRDNPLAIILEIKRGTEILLVYSLRNGADFTRRREWREICRKYAISTLQYGMMCEMTLK